MIVSREELLNIVEAKETEDIVNLISSSPNKSSISLSQAIDEIEEELDKIREYIDRLYN